MIFYAEILFCDFSFAGQEAATTSLRSRPWAWDKVLQEVNTSLIHQPGQFSCQALHRPPLRIKK
jgi:hypothetical protein